MGFFRPLLGEPKWWDIAISPIRDTSGKPVRLLAVSRDVTERKRAETNLEVLAAVTQDLLRFTGVDETMAIMAAKLARILAHRCVPLFTLIEQQAR